MLQETVEKGLEKRIHVIPGAELRPRFSILASADHPVCEHLQFNRRFGEGRRGKWQFVSQGLFLLKKNKLQSPFLQGQETRGTVKTSFSDPAPADARFPRGRRPLASAVRRGDSRTGSGGRSTVHSAPWDVNPRRERLPLTPQQRGPEGA